jgi:hypothetical protein
VAVFGLLIVPTLLHKKHHSSLSDKDRAARTIDAMSQIHSGEESYLTAHHRFTPHLADLLGANSKLANDLAIGLDVQLDVSTNGKRYLAQVTSDVLRLVREYTGATATARSCLVLKSSSGVNCPP